MTMEGSPARQEDHADFERRIQPPEGTDLWAVRTNFISVTPLCLDYTDRGTFDRLGAAFARSEVVEAP